jgi:phosphopantothenoylcysteine decarboxylase/phosphopantothenate--cysteine ligase
MNSVMLNAPAVQRNLDLLRKKGDTILPTGEGVLACGEVGHGKLLDVAHIIAYLKSHRALKTAASALAGRKVLISLGHTKEKWDDVRFISNRSSGKTGLALARAFQLAGAQVEVVAGATEETPSPGLVAALVESSADFRKEMLSRQASADVVIMAAAIADFTPVQPKKGKVKDSKSLARIDLKPFPNILKELGERKKPGQVLVGFALETENALAYGRAKMEERNCDLLVVNNPVFASSGFGKGKVQASLLTRGGNSSRGKTAKGTALAEWDKDDLAAAVVAETAKLLGA